MSDFQWQTEEEIDWERSETVASQTRTQRYQRRYLLWGGLTLILAIALAATLTRQLQERIAEGQARVEADLLASVELIHETAEKQDQDVFTLLLSGRDPDWGDQLAELVGQGLLYDRTLLGLTAQGEPTVDVELSSNLLEAEVATAHAYRYAPLGRPPRILTLTQTAVYRKGENRWLLAPPEEAFWGEGQTFEAERLSVDYSERDADFATYFANRLQDDLDTLCDHVACPPPSQLQLLISFGDSPALLSHRALHAPLQPPIHYADPELLYTLPSPTIFGAPQDEAASAILYEIYATHLLRSLLNLIWLSDTEDGRFSVNFLADCCEQPLFRRALLDNELARAGLFVWPDPEGDYSAWEGEGLFAPLAPLWEASDLRELHGREEQLYAAINYLRNLPGALPPAEAARRLSEVRSYDEWLRRMSSSTIQSGGWPANQPAVELDQQLQLEALLETFVKAEEETAAFENTFLYATCAQPGGGAVRLAQFTPLATQQAAVLNAEFAHLQSTPRLDQLVVTLDTFSQGASANGYTLERRNLLWEDGQSRPLFVPEMTNFELMFLSPAGKYALFNNYMDEDGVNPLLVPLESCSSLGCSSMSINTFPIWSPDDRYALVHLEGEGLRWPLTPSSAHYLGNFASDEPPADIYLADEAGRVTNSTPVGFGRNPVWLDNGRFAFISERPLAELISSTIEELVVYDIAQAAPVTTLSTADLLATLPIPLADTTSFTIERILPLLQMPEQLLIITHSDDPVHTNEIFRYHLAEQQLDHLVTLPDITAYLNFSPNGRYLLVTQGNWGGPQSSLSPTIESRTLYDLDEAIPLIQLPAPSPDSHPLNFAWSPDGDWLAVQIAANQLAFFEPETDERLLHQHNLGDCHTFQWLNTAAYP